VRTQRDPEVERVPAHAAEPDLDRNNKARTEGVADRTRTEGVPSGGYRGAQRDYMDREATGTDVADRKAAREQTAGRQFGREAAMREQQARPFDRDYAEREEQAYRGPLGYPMKASLPTALLLLGGTWLIVSRLVFNYTAAGSTPGGVLNGAVIGLILILVAVARLVTWRSSPTLGAASAILGAWMIASPWVFGYAHWGAGSRPTWSDVITGAVILLSGLATWSAGEAIQRADRAGAGAARYAS
jgi:hypothetical protein